MHVLSAKVVLAGVALAVPLWAFGQVIPVIPPVRSAPHANKHHAQTPVWESSGNSLSITASGHTGAAVPAGNTTPLDGRTRAAGAGVKLTTKPGLTAHAKVDEIHWAPLASPCAPGDQTCLNDGVPLDGVRRGEVGAGFAGKDVRFGVSLGQSRSNSGASPTALRGAGLPRVLPAEGGADVAAPLWFRNSTATSISARGQISVAPGTSLNLGASVGRVRFLPGSGLAGDDSVDQTTLSLGVRRGAVSGAIVGHVLEPTLPGAALDQNQRWSGIDLGISVHLPWRGELNFGAQNVWSSGRAPLLFGPGKDAMDPGRVPYVQYHQDL